MRRLGLWWVPLILMAAPLAGRMPAHRDLVDFFAPMRAATAVALDLGVAPWLNFANGCGEAWFANPETAVLYPPAWLHLLVPGPWAITAEVALHLAWFSLGVGLVAAGLGARRWGRSLAEAAAWSAGPVLATVGVLNNLETLAWLPWMVLAARLEDRRQVPLVAVTTALAWLGGEPQIWALGVLLVVTVSPRRGWAMGGLALGVGMVAVQFVPFLFWVFEGDRGQAAGSWVLRGALLPADWLGVLAPGLARDSGRMVYAESLFVGVPVLVCMLLGVRNRLWIVATVAVCAVLATLPEIGGGELFLRLTGGLMRYPSRFALVGLALLLPFFGTGAEAWLAGAGRRLAVAMGVLGLAVCATSHHPWRWWVAGGPAAFVLVAALLPAQRWLRGAAVAVGLAAMVVAGMPLLDLRSPASFEPPGPTWPEADEGGRVWTPTPSADVMGWLASGVGARRLWPIGYLNLDEGFDLARTYAPVANKRLEEHLRWTDEGPERRWWLNTLAARWAILPTSADLPAAMEEIRRQAGMRLLRNLEALPMASLAAAAPQMEEPWQGVGSVAVIARRPQGLVIATASRLPAWLWLSLAPVRGWRWRLDGRPAELPLGPGILQYVEIPEGHHRLEGLYRPPLLVPMTAVSLLSLMAVVFLLLSRARVGRTWATG